MNKASLKISISPRDLRLLYYTLPHQLKFWHDLVEEVLIVLDLHGYNSKEYLPSIESIYTLKEELGRRFPKVRLIEVDYSEQAKKAISNAYFGGARIPSKTHRYGPYYSYFYGLYHTSYDYVLNIDSDILFGGFNPLWIEEAIRLLADAKSIISCSPLPGAPRADGKLLRQIGKIDSSELRKVTFDSISTRIFFIHKPSFRKMICPIPVKIAKWSLLLRAILRNKPIYELPEDTISDIMRAKNLIRVDFLGTNIGVWSLHPPYRNEEFYQKLPEIIQLIEKDEIPLEQRGDYDLNSSMVNWSDARLQITNASIKRKILKAFKLVK